MTINNYNFSDRTATIDAIAKECFAQGFENKEQVAYVLATVDHETNKTFKPVREAYWLGENWRKQNLRYYPYYGRGFVQITWKANYQKYSDLLNKDFVSDPDGVMEPNIALFILIHGFKTGSFTGKKITDYINTEKTDFYNARRCINGLDKAKQIEQLAKLYLHKVLPTISWKNFSESSTEVRRGNLSVRLAPGQKSTLIKYSPHLQASEIEQPELKYLLEEPNQLEIVWVEDVGNHYKFELEKPINGRYNWFAFEQHVVIYDDEKDVPVRNLEVDGHESKTVNLAVPYRSQRDNKIRPLQTCNMTSAAMVVEFLYPGTDAQNSKQLEDEMTKYCIANWGRDAIYYHNKIVETLAHWKVKSVFSTTTPFTKMKEHLSTGLPVIYSGKFTQSGHIIVLRGFDNKGFFVNDAWGEWFSTGYQNKSGENLHYSYSMMSLLSYGGANAGWSHLCFKM